MQNKQDEKVFLSAGLERLHLSVSDVQVQKLIRYLDLLYKWNNVYNLTSIKNRNEALTSHLLDSASLVPTLTQYLKLTDGNAILDVGCGAGLPGIPTAILDSQAEITLVDTVGKKIAFVKQAIIQLNLENAHAIQSRVEQMEDSEKFNVIISRAFTSIKNFIELTEHLLEENGYWIIMKGKYPEEEISEIPPGIKLVEVKKIEVPFLETDRHLIILSRS